MLYIYVFFLSFLRYVCEVLINSQVRNALLLTVYNLCILMLGAAWEGLLGHAMWWCGGGVKEGVEEGGRGRGKGSKRSGITWS